MELLNRQKRRNFGKYKKTNNRGNGQTRAQIVWSEPRRILVGRYLTKKGMALVASGIITHEFAMTKYGKNRYKINPAAKPVKIIFHRNIYIEY